MEAMEIRWLDDREQTAWRLLAAVLELLPGVLDKQLRRDSGLTHFEYFSLFTLSEAPQRTLHMTALASQTSSTLPRLSHVVRRLEERGLVKRFASPEDGRTTNVRLTGAGRELVQDAAQGHVANVREHVIDALDACQVDQLAEIAEAVLNRLDPEGVMAAPYRRHDTSGTSPSASPAAGAGILHPAFREPAPNSLRPMA
jgi:DNA-binding MarR family transcriptional regulator